MKILILNASPDSYSTRRLKETAEKRKHEVEVYAPEDFYLELSNVNGHDKLFLKTEEGKEVRVYSDRYDAVIPRIVNLTYGSLVVEQINQNLNIFCTSTAEGLKIATDKFLTCQKLSQAKVRVPKQIIAQKPLNYGFLVDRVKLPFVAKTQNGSQGAGVFILESKLSSSTTLEAFSKLDTNIILQEFLKSAKEEENANDIRVFIVDSKVIAAYKRLSMDDDFRSNYSKSHQGEKVQLTKEEEQMAIDAAQAVGLSGICGVDLMRAEGKTYCIECNGNPGLQGVEAVTGVDVAGAIIDYVERSQKGQNKKQEEAKQIAHHQVSGTVFCASMEEMQQYFAGSMSFTDFLKASKANADWIVKEIKQNEIV